MRTPAPGLVLAAALAAVLALATGCGPRARAASPSDPGTAAATSAEPAGGPSPAPTVSAAAPAGSPPAAAGCAAVGDLKCAHLAAAASRVGAAPGRLSVTVRDRVTGARWHAGDTGFATWTASTIKVAIAVDVLRRQRAGTATLTATDRDNLDRMLRVSDNTATDAIWARFDGPTMVARFRDYGMTGLGVVPGYDVHWRHLRCAVADLERLMSYALEKTAPDDRAYLVRTLRGVGANQRWGVWSAGPGQSPGNKDGWAFKPDRNPDHWVVHSVGFAGPGERYVVAMMYDQPPGADEATGVHAVSDLVATLFGAAVPARVTPP